MEALDVDHYRSDSRRPTSDATSKFANAKYCSDRCKRHKPGLDPSSVDSRIEHVIHNLLEGRAPNGDVANNSTGHWESRNAKTSKKAKKGDSRIIVRLSDVEAAVFAEEREGQFAGRKRTGPRKRVSQEGEWRSVDMEDHPPPSGYDFVDEYGDEGQEGGVKLSQYRSSEVDEAHAPEDVGESPEQKRKQREGQRRAEEKEHVKRVARRVVVFGLVVEGEEKEERPKKAKNRGDTEECTEPARKKCEALMDGQLVEPSFAKGDWSLRWRED